MALFGQQGVSASVFIVPALVISLALQSALAALLLWEGTRRKALRKKLKRTRREKKDLTQASKTIEKKVGEQEKEINKAQGVEERAALLDTQVKDMELLHKELKSEIAALERENASLEGKVEKLEKKGSGNTSLLERAKQLMRKGSGS